MNIKGNYLLTVLVVLCLYSVFVSGEILCVEKGTCVPCKSEDMFHDYCKPTGRMIRILCNNGETQYEEIRGCPLTAEDEQIRVIVFQAAMCLIGGLAYWAVQKRKLGSLSLFDSRRLRYTLNAKLTNHLYLYHVICILLLRSQALKMRLHTVLTTHSFVEHAYL